MPKKPRNQQEDKPVVVIPTLGELQDPDAEEGQSYTAEIDWHIPEEMQSRFATHLVVQHSEGEFFLHFFELRPPLILGDRKQQLAQFKGIKSLRAQCTARVAIAANRMPEFIQLLQQNLETYKLRYGQLENETGGEKDD